MTKPAALLIDAENAFNQIPKKFDVDGRRYSRDLAALLDELLRDLVERKLDVDTLRYYGKPKHPSFEIMTDHILATAANVHRRWAVVLVPDGKDVADDILVDDMTWMSRTEDGQVIVTVSEDIAILAAVVDARAAGADVRVVVRGTCSTRCPTRGGVGSRTGQQARDKKKVAQLAGDHEHLLDVYHRRQESAYNRKLQVVSGAGPLSYTRPPVVTSSS